MPHESTVNPYEHVKDDYGQLRRGRGISSNSICESTTPSGLASSSMASLTEQVAASELENKNKPETPSRLTHHEEFDDDDEDSDEAKSPVRQ